MQARPMKVHPLQGSFLHRSSWAATSALAHRVEEVSARFPSPPYPSLTLSPAAVKGHTPFALGA